MKTKVNLIRYGLASLLMLILVVFTQCISPKTVYVDQAPADANAINIPTDGLLPQDVNAPDVGVKDTERIFMTMSALTGVPTTNGIRNTYNTVYKTQLPSSYRLESFQESQMLATMKIATEFCNIMLNTVALREAVWPANQVNFGTANLFANNVATREAFIDALMYRFWGDGVLEPIEYEEGAEMIEQLMLDAMAAGSNTLNTAKLACSAALSSAHVVIE